MQNVIYIIIIIIKIMWMKRKKKEIILPTYLLAMDKNPNFSSRMEIWNNAWRKE